VCKCLCVSPIVILRAAQIPWESLSWWPDSELCVSSLKNCLLPFCCLGIHFVWRVDNFSYWHCSSNLFIWKYSFKNVKYLDRKARNFLFGREKGLVSLRAQHQPQGTTELSLGNSQWTLEQSIDSFSKRRYKTGAKPTVHKKSDLWKERSGLRRALSSLIVLNSCRTIIWILQASAILSLTSNKDKSRGDVFQDLSTASLSFAYCIFSWRWDNRRAGARFYRLIKGVS
jgi:hypothetical protein